ncbi:MAG: uroporphyrinogen decarboxylase family protein [Chthoniobacteraceae bacterium]|nr:uroporphyrinogen decarboxylase family protein [Chthoniobacteraceae bacterium]
MNPPKREPNFQNVLDLLARRPTAKPVLFEFIINRGHIERLAGEPLYDDSGDINRVLRLQVKAFWAAGYDYAFIPPWLLGGMSFPIPDRDRAESVGMAHGGVIRDRESFEKYPWPDPEATGWDALERLKPHVPDGMKLIICSNGGVLENLVSLLGYEDLCLMLEDDPELVHEIVDAIGSRLLRLYELGLQHDSVGAAMVNDDWGFKSQPFLAPAQMRAYVTPWHRRIVQAIHSAGRPATMHSCGELKLLWEDIIEDLKFDGKHSYEDTILPVEEAYERYGSRIAILGGIDVDFLCRATPEAIYRRCKAMIERTQTRGGYGLGSGNSIADYVPAENFDALLRAARE